MPTPDRHPHAVVRLPHLSTAKDVSLGMTHGVALLEDGTIASWGRNEGGQLGRRSPRREASEYGVVSRLRGVIAVSDRTSDMPTCIGIWWESDMEVLNVSVA